MNKQYSTPEMEVINFKLTTDILTGSDPEGELPTQDDVITGDPFGI